MVVLNSILLLVNCLMNIQINLLLLKPCDEPFEGTIFHDPLRTDKDSIDFHIPKKIYNLKFWPCMKRKHQLFIIFKIFFSMN
jgi:hypothetical protein